MMRLSKPSQFMGSARRQWIDFDHGAEFIRVLSCTIQNVAIVVAIAAMLDQNYPLNCRALHRVQKRLQRRANRRWGGQLAIPGVLRRVRQPDMGMSVDDHVRDHHCLLKFSLTGSAMT